MGMYISVTTLRDTPGQAAPFAFEADGAELDAAVSVTFVGSVEVRGTLQAVGEYYRVEGTVKYSKSFVCDRCLAETVLTETIPFSEKFFPRSGSQTDVDDSIRRPAKKGETELKGEVETEFDGDVIDLFPVVSDTLVASQPMQNLCRSDCRGLCSKCGHDLNLGDCGCDRRAVDPRLAALADFFKD